MFFFTQVHILYILSLRFYWIETGLPVGYAFYSVDLNGGDRKLEGSVPLDANINKLAVDEVSPRHLGRQCTPHLPIKYNSAIPMALSLFIR